MGKQGAALALGKSEVAERMLGYLIAGSRGEADRLLFATATALQAKGWSLAGAVQTNYEAASSARCDMDLHVLAMDRVVRISQNLGSQSTGCRLDPSALATAVGFADAALSKSPKLCIVNKFGKAEIEGNGFRSFIGSALAQGIPVLTSVNTKNIAPFLDYVEGFGQELAPDEQAILDWCHASVA